MQMEEDGTLFLKLFKRGEGSLLLSIDASGFLAPYQVQRRGLSLLGNLMISFHTPVSLE